MDAARRLNNGKAQITYQEGSIFMLPLRKVVMLVALLREWMEKGNIWIFLWTSVRKVDDAKS
jgi:hypothetical protein